jgi:murein L,D-transpeptidase YcbB/YkuD
LSGDLKRADTLNIDLFDENVEEALINFQQRHGLEADGILGEKTLMELNIPAAKRADQIALNLERWRWLPQEMGKEFVLINLPDLKLFVYEEEKILLEMRAIIGRSYRRTPVFSDKITYLVLNPFWFVPNSIAVKDILPEIKKDVNYLKRLKIKVLSGENTVVDIRSIDWSKVTEKNFKYRLRQDPGLNNALGRIKFMFPNKFNVYIHDTPSKELFKKPEREFSSGCIRIEGPIELAVSLLDNDPDWDRERLLKEINKNVQKTVTLKKPIPVHLLYWTAWADEGNKILFRRDIYQRDQALLSALREKPPRER